MMSFNIFKISQKCLLLLILGLVFACNSHNEQKKSNVSNDSIKTSVKDNAYLKSVYYRFPTPDEIFGFINNEKLKFDQTYLNPAENAEKYLDSKTQTIGLGIYVSDLAYVTLFEAYNKSAEYYRLIHLLSEKIRITSAYDLEVAKRIDKNLMNLDSLKSISVDSYSSMVEYLIVNSREKTLALIAAGSYIECFYIAFNLAGNYSQSNPMILKIVDLKYAFDNLYSYLQIYSNDESVKSVAKQLSNLNLLFGKMKETSIGKTTVKQDKDGNLVLGGGTKLNIDNILYIQLKKEVFKLRKEMINSY
jgi:hypothetical protein